MIGADCSLAPSVSSPAWARRHRPRAAGVLALPFAGCWRRRRCSRRSRQRRAASPGCTRTRCRRTATCRRRWGPGGVLRLRQRRLDGHLHGQQRRQPTSTQPKTPLKNALYKNNRDGTFTDVTEKAGVAGGTSSAWAAPSATTTTTAIPDILVTAYGRCTLYHNNGNGTFTDVTDKAGVAAPGWTTSAVWFDYDNDGKLDLFLCSFVEFSLDEQRVLRRQQAGQALLLHPARLQADAQPALPQQRRRHVHRGQRRHRHPARARQGARRRRHRHQRRRPDGSVRRQRHGAELPVREPRQGQVGGDRAGGGGRLQRQRHAALGHGRRRRRLRRRRLAGSVRRQRRSGDVLALPERRQRVLLRRRGARTASRRRRGC